MRILLALLLWPLSCTAEDGSFDWDWTLSAATAQSTDSPFFSPTDAERQTLDALLDVQTHWQGMTGRLALRATNVLSSDEEAHDGEVIIQEWFWHHSFSSVDATAGKLRLDWGVGYGYRPLDIFKPYRRHPVGIQVEEGAGTLLLSHFDALGDWSVVATDSSWTQQEGSELEQAAHDICRFRETFRAFIHLAITEKAVPLDHPVIDEINRILADSSQVPKISRLGDPKLVTVHRYERATDLLPRIAVECARFICEADFRYIRVCEGPSCTLLFLDISKNHRRRWCSMEVCGNRAKAAAYRKSKAERPS